MGSISAGFGSTKEFNESGGSSTETKSVNSEFGVSISPGFTYLFGKKLGLDLSYGSLSYGMNTTKPEDSDTKTTDTNFGLNLNFKTLAIGFVYLFDCDSDD